MHEPPAPVVVVGAGPAGLAVARALARRGVAATVLERDRVAASWARHYEHLTLHTRKGAAALPGLRYPAGTPTFPRRDDVVAYLRAYAERFVPDLHEGVEVRGLAPAPAAVPGAAGWRLETSAGAIAARAVVVATGIASAPFAPRVPGAAAFAGPLRHAADYRGPEGDAGRRVLVVGAGNTGVDLALALAQTAAAVDLSVRDGLALVPCPTPLSQHAGTLLQALPPAIAEAALRRVRRAYPELGLPWPSGPLREAFPVVGHRLVEAVRAGRVGVRPGVVAFTADGARFADGAEAPYDAVWLATGYRAATGWAAPWLTSDPEGSAGVRVALGAAGLHPLGFAYPSLTSWLQALPRAADRTARAVVADLRRTDR
jgi:cation diffusion facilitator CzcD-associated flavoprotein CzcO